MSEQDMQRLAEMQGAGGGMGPADYALFAVIGVVYILLLAGMWKAFAKAGEPGWACIVPIYNLVVMVKISGKPIWWFVLLLVPCVGIIIAFLVSVAIAERFGKGAGFGVGLAFFPYIFWPILGFGSAQYSPARA